MLLEFAHVNNTAPQGGGPGRTYDWQNKHYFALSPMELGSVLAAAPGETLKFFHDPAKLGKAGDVRRSGPGAVWILGWLRVCSVGLHATACVASALCPAWQGCSWLECHTGTPK